MRVLLLDRRIKRAAVNWPRASTPKACSRESLRPGASGVCGHSRRSSDEPIAAAWDGFYEARVLRIVAENRPDIADGPFSTESLTKRWPQTSSSRACFVSSAPG